MTHPGASIPGVADSSNRGLTASTLSPRSAARWAVLPTRTPERVALTLGTCCGVGLVGVRIDRRVADLVLHRALEAAGYGTELIRTDRERTCRGEETCCGNSGDDVF